MTLEQRASELLLWDLRRQEAVAHLTAEFGITVAEANAAVTAAQRRVLLNNSSP